MLFRSAATLPAGDGVLADFVCAQAMATSAPPIITTPVRMTTPDSRFFPFASCRMYKRFQAIVGDAEAQRARCKGGQASVTRRRSDFGSLGALASKPFTRVALKPLSGIASAPLHRTAPDARNDVL